MIILADEVSNPLMTQQLTVLCEDEKALRERRLVIYQVLPDAYRLAFPKIEEWDSADNEYARPEPKGERFEVRLREPEGRELVVVRRP